MDNRRAALRKILSATGVQSRLTELQHRELLDHLEDSMDRKVNQGASEAEAIVQSFDALGNLDDVAADFRAASPLAVAVDGALPLPARVKVMSRVGLMVSAYLMLLWAVVPKFSAFMKDMDVTLQLPWATRLLIQASNVSGGVVWFSVACLVLAGAWVTRVPWTQTRGKRILRISGWVFFILTVVSFTLPILYIVGAARQ